MGKGDEEFPLHLSFDSTKMKADSATKLCVSLHLSIWHILVKEIYQGPDRKAADEVRVTSCSDDFSQK